MWHVACGSGQRVGVGVRSASGSRPKKAQGVSTSTSGMGSLHRTDRRCSVLRRSLYLAELCARQCSGNRSGTPTCSALDNARRSVLDHNIEGLVDIPGGLYGLDDLVLRELVGHDGLDVELAPLHYVHDALDVLWEVAA